MKALLIRISLLVTVLAFSQSNFSQDLDKVKGAAAEKFKEEAVQKIGDCLKDKNWIAEQKAAIKKKNADNEGSKAFFTDSLILFANGDWLAYAANSESDDMVVGDVLVGKGSDGKTYFSSYQFKKGLSVLVFMGQPASLKTFVKDYELKPLKAAAPATKK